MLISHSHRFIFFHIGKTAGMSMRNVLQSYCEEPEKFKIARPIQNKEKTNKLCEVWQTLLLHAKAVDAQKELSSEIFDNFFKFAFVRNPWDLQVSMYHFILREPNSNIYNQVKQLGSFEAFVEWVVKTPNPYPKGITKFQHEMVVDEQGNLLVDFVGRYENLQHDFDFVRQKLNFTESLPHLNRSEHKHYQDYYNAYTKNLIAEHFKDDIELFGYNFSY